MEEKEVEDKESKGIRKGGLDREREKGGKEKKEREERVSRKK